MWVVFKMPHRQDAIIHIYTENMLFKHSLDMSQ